MDIRKLILNVILLITAIVLGFLLYFSRELLAPCGKSMMWYLEASLYLLFPIPLYFFLKRIKVNVGWAAIIVIIISIVSYRRGQNFISRDIDTSGGVVKTAVIYDRYSSLRIPSTIYISYIVEGEQKSTKYVCDKENYKSLLVGDTILIVYSLRCPDWTLPFNYFPTPKEIRQCEEGCLLKNGELLVFE